MRKECGEGDGCEHAKHEETDDVDSDASIDVDWVLEDLESGDSKWLAAQLGAHAEELLDNALRRVALAKYVLDS